MSAKEDDPYHVSRHAESKIVLKMTLIAEQRCKEIIDAYNKCAKGRTFGMLFSCKGLYNVSQDCFHTYVNDDSVLTVKKRWVDAGKPTKPNWDEMLAGVDRPLPPAVEEAIKKATAPKS